MSRLMPAASCAIRWASVITTGCELAEGEPGLGPVRIVFHTSVVVLLVVVLVLVVLLVLDDVADVDTVQVVSPHPSLAAAGDVGMLHAAAESARDAVTEDARTLIPRRPCMDPAP